MSGCPFLHGDAAAAPSAPTFTPLSDTQLTPETPDMTPPDQPPTEKPSILGFQTSTRRFFSDKHPACHYSTYLGVEELLQLQSGPAACKPEGQGMMHHEEMTFVVIHQVFELWFKLVLCDLDEGRRLLLTLTKGSEKAELADLDTEEFHRCVSLTLHYLRRTERIFEHASGAFAVMETMHPSDFLEYRDYLVPASGFQSVQFRQLEQLLGVVDATRAKVNGAPVLSYLLEEEQKGLRASLGEPSLNDICVNLLASLDVPATFERVFIDTTVKVLEFQQYDVARLKRGDEAPRRLIERKVEEIRAVLDDPVSWCDGLEITSEDARSKFRSAVLGALFAISYRHEQKYAVLALLLDQFIAVEEGMLLWRSRHLHMAERMIGRRSGTGGTGSGVGYLDVTRRYRIFHALWLARKLAVRSSALPPLSEYADHEMMFSRTNHPFLGESTLVSPDQKALHEDPCKKK